MKNKAERRNLLIGRALDAMESGQFERQLRHHTDLPVHSVERIGHAMWITLSDGAYYKLEVCCGEPGRRPLPAAPA